MDWFTLWFFGIAGFASFTGLTKLVDAPLKTTTKAEWRKRKDFTNAAKRGGKASTASRRAETSSPSQEFDWDDVIARFKAMMAQRYP
jgi:hypothetical protein